MLSIEIVQYAIAAHQTCSDVLRFYVWSIYGAATISTPFAVGHCLEKL